MKPNNKLLCFIWNILGYPGLQWFWLVCCYWSSTGSQEVKGWQPSFFKSLLCWFD